MTIPTPTSVEDPLADWGNDDLLFETNTRAYAAAAHPRLLSVLDWPELRARFAGFDQAANTARKASRKAGVRACILGYIGLLITALMPLLTRGHPHVPQVLGPLAASFAAVSTLWGYAMVLHGQQKAQWLSNRYWTERLRQLHFQLIINHLPLVVQIMRGDAAALAEWKALRTAALARFNHLHVDEVTDTMARMEADEAEHEFWLDPAWERCGDAPPSSPELEEIYSVLKDQRFEIQRRFSSLKTAPDNWHSSSMRSNKVSAISDTLTFFVLMTVIVGGALLGFGWLSDSLAIQIIIAVSGVFSGTVVLLRVLNEGLQLNSEAERYTWYKATVSSLSERFSRADGDARLDILRDMERLSYQEMRWFLISFKQARFIM